MDDQSCFYIDRLVDFGLGMGVANQMVGIMNQYTTVAADSITYLLCCH